MSENCRVDDCKKRLLEADIDALVKENEQLRAEIAALKRDIASDIFTQDPLPDGEMAEGRQRGQ